MSSPSFLCIQIFAISRIEPIPPHFSIMTVPLSIIMCQLVFDDNWASADHGLLSFTGIFPFSLFIFFCFSAPTDYGFSPKKVEPAVLESQYQFVDTVTFAHQKFLSPWPHD